MGRNEIAELAQNAELGCRWAGLIFHTLPSGRFKCPRPSNPQLFRLHCGTAVSAILTRLRGLEAKNNYFQASKARKPAILQGFRFQKGL